MNKNWQIDDLDLRHHSTYLLWVNFRSRKVVHQIGGANKTSWNSANICCTTGYPYLITAGWFVLEGPPLLLTLGAFCFCVILQAIFEREYEAFSQCPPMYVIYYGRIVAVADLFLYSCMYCMCWQMYLQPDLCFQCDGKGSMCVSLERS